MYLHLHLCQIFDTLNMVNVVTYRWEDVVEHEYALRLMKLCQPAPADQRAVDQMHQNPTGWSLAHYKQLAQLLSVMTVESGGSLANVGDVMQYIESLTVSSESVCICVRLCSLP